jgi:hypothetical protein
MIKNPLTKTDRLINAFGGIRPFAAALGHRNASTVQGWREAGVIPPYRRFEVEAACKEHGVEFDAELFESEAA